MWFSVVRQNKPRNTLLEMMGVSDSVNLGEKCHRALNDICNRNCSYYYCIQIIFIMKRVLIALLIVISLVFVYLSTQGLFQRVVVEQRVMPGYRVAGIQHKGPYEKIGETFNQIHKVADEQGVPVKMIGVYFDNPNEVAPDSLRSMAGIIVSESDSVKLSALSNMTFLSIPAGEAAVANFETGGMVSMIIGAMKSYPKLTEYVESNGIAERVNFVYELYGEGKTEYIIQLSGQ